MIALVLITKANLVKSASNILATITLITCDKVHPKTKPTTNDNKPIKKVSTTNILDIFPLNREVKSKNEKRYTRESVKLIKKLYRISKRLNCPIIIVAGVELKKQYNSFKCISPQDIDIGKINRFIDNYIILNCTNENKIFSLDVYNKEGKVRTCKLKYDYDIRKFEEI